jgi:hypothetical protein
MTWKLIYSSDPDHKFISKLRRCWEKKTIFVYFYKLLNAAASLMLQWKLAEAKILQIKKSKKLGYQENEAAQTGSPHPNISTT